MSPASRRSPSSVATRFATCATAGRPHMPMSPAAIIVTVCPAPPPDPEPPPLGPDGDAHAVAAARVNSNRYFMQPLPSFTIRGTVSPPSRMTRSAAKPGKIDRMVLSPQEPLITGGPAEELERRIQDTFKAGYEHVVIDLRGVPTADSGGIRALVRGHTSAQRLNRRFTLVSPNPRVMELLELSLLTRVLEVVDSLGEAKARTVPWDRVVTGVAVTMVGLALVGIGVSYPDLGLDLAPAAPGALTNQGPVPPVTSHFSHPLFELAKLIAAAVIGMLVTIVHRQYRAPAERQANPAMDQAQVLLCISGAMMMIIIGNNLARAFGIAGAASIIRFRTPVRSEERRVGKE